jgi:hypothetical protein
MVFSGGTVCRSWLVAWLLPDGLLVQEAVSVTFALIFYASTWALPTIIHGYIDKNECERAATFLVDPDDANTRPTHIWHSCIPEHDK